MGLSAPKTLSRRLKEDNRLSFPKRESEELMTIQITPFTMADYDEAMELWGASEGIGLSQADQPERIAAYLDRNPRMSYCARENGILLGAVLAGHDGRRGFLHHLAVRPGRRGEGIGRALAGQSLDALREAGIDKCHLFVFRENRPAIEFWQKTGWRERIELVLMSANL